MTQTRVQDAAVQALKLFGLPTAPGHAACIQEASCAPKEWDLWPLSCTCSPAPSHPSRQEISSAGPAYPHTCSTGEFSSVRKSRTASLSRGAVLISQRQR